MTICQRKLRNCDLFDVCWTSLLLLLINLLGVGTSFAQDRSRPKIPPPVDMVLRTVDGVNLHCTYFEPVDLTEKKTAPGTEVADEVEEEWGKTVIPWILVHDWDGRRQDLFAFAEELQRRGSNAVIVPDLRGHGRSTSVEGASAALERSKFRRRELQAVINDIERCKRFLIQENNQGKLNIDLLNIVAVGQSAVVAMTWVINDWYAFPPYAGNIKQAQDVKTITLISPQRRFSSINMNVELKHPMFSGRDLAIPNIPTLIAWGTLDESAEKDSSFISETMRKGRPDTARIEDPELRRQNTTLYSFPLELKSTGTELIRTHLALRETIVQFVALKVGAQRDRHPWQDRSRK